MLTSSENIKENNDVFSVVRENTLNLLNSHAEYWIKVDLSKEQLFSGKVYFLNFGLRIPFQGIINIEVIKAIFKISASYSGKIYFRRGYIKFLLESITENPKKRKSKRIAKMLYNLNSDK